MVTLMRSAVDEYKILYKQTEWKLEIAEGFNERYRNKINKLEDEIKMLKEENNAYKILLKQKLEEEENVR